MIQVWLFNLKGTKIVITVIVAVFISIFNFHKAKIHSDIFDITSHHKSMWVKLQIFLRPEAECFLVA